MRNPRVMTGKLRYSATPLPLYRSRSVLSVPLGLNHSVVKNTIVGLQVLESEHFTVVRR
jgi:hypothetical protein